MKRSGRQSYPDSYLGGWEESREGDIARTDKTELRIGGNGKFCNVHFL